MSQNSLTTTSTAMTPERIDRGLEWLKHSLPSLKDCPETRRKAEAAVMALSEPAHPARVMARVLALLNPYFDKDTPQAIREIEAEDWAVALQGKPYWAIERAARWWKSDANPDRRKRPLEGDIAARVRKELDAVNAARLMLATQANDPANHRDRDRERLPEHEREKMRARMAEVGNAALETMRRKMEDL